MTTATPIRPAFLTVEEAADYIRLGRSKTYELITAGEFPHVKIGRATRVPFVGLKDWVDRQVEAAREAADAGD
jgi:excisionase family DNA binding protein